MSYHWTCRGPCLGCDGLSSVPSPLHLMLAGWSAVATPTASAHRIVPTMQGQQMWYLLMGVLLLADGLLLCACPAQTPRAPPPPVAAMLSPILWQLNCPDRFDMYSAGVLLLQVLFFTPMLLADACTTWF